MFIELHDYGDGSPILINAEDIVMVADGRVVLHTEEITVQEGYEEIKSILIGDCYEDRSS